MNVALGVGGGIAAYKAAELARALMERGFTVDVIMTRAAEEFIRPLTFAALTGRKVHTQSVFGGERRRHARQRHRTHPPGAGESNLLVVAPATADLLAKFAHGLADDLLTTTYLAFTGTVVLAPAMNTNMWNHPATQRNLRSAARARARDRRTGRRAAGLRHDWAGTIGRAGGDRRRRARREQEEASRRDLEGETILITAGPTQEPIDGVRYLSNRSSGKMGYALAEEAAARGAHVVLVSGPVSLAPPREVTLIPVRTAMEMRQAVMDHLAEATIVIKAAAVADYHVPNPSEAQDEEDGGAPVAGSGADARHSGRAGHQERRPPADRVRRRNRATDRGSPPQDAAEELRHGGGESGFCGRGPDSKPTKTKWCW